MRVAFNLEQLLQRPPGGIGRYTAELARLLPALSPADAEAEDRVDLVPFVALHSRAKVTAALRSFGLEAPQPRIVAVPRPLLYDSWHLLGAPRLPSLLGSRRVDLVHAPSVAVPPRGRVPLVVTVHDAAPLLFPDAYPRRGRRFHRQGMAAAVARADLLITVSRAAADELVGHAGASPDRLRVVPNGTDLMPATDDDVRSARRSLGLGDHPYVLWVGTLEPRKNVGVLCQAFARWARASDRPHRLVLVSAGRWMEDGRAVLGPARALGERLRAVGWVDDARLRALYRGADLLALPSRHEGFGLPVLEAMAQGTAVICSDIPALREVAGDVARLVPPDDPEAWAAALGALVEDEGARSRMGEEGRRRAEGYSWQRCAAATRRVYREALDRR